MSDYIKTNTIFKAVSNPSLLSYNTSDIVVPETSGVNGPNGATNGGYDSHITIDPITTLSLTSTWVIVGIQFTSCPYSSPAASNVQRIAAITQVHFCDISDLNTQSNVKIANFALGTVGNSDCSTNVSTFRCPAGKAIVELNIMTWDHLMAFNFGYASVYDLTDPVVYSNWRPQNPISGWNFTFKGPNGVRMPLVGFTAYFANTQGWGVRWLSQAIFRDIATVASNIYNKSDYQYQCLLNPTNPLCNIPFSKASAVQNTCSTNFDSGCLDFCKQTSSDPGTIVACDSAALNYCANNPTAINTTTGSYVCGCHMPQSFYDNIAVNISKSLPGFTTDTNPYCFYNKCSDPNALKTKALRDQLPTCPSITNCIQDVSVDTSGANIQSLQLNPSCQNNVNNNSSSNTSNSTTNSATNSITNSFISKIKTKWGLFVAGGTLTISFILLCFVCVIFIIIIVMSS